MALCTMHLFSEALGMQTTVNVVIPQNSTSGEIGVSESKGGKHYKCLYLLHGLSDDGSIWLRRTSIERYAQEYGICVVMPFAAKSFYTDMKYGEKYYTYIAEELPKLMHEFFHLSDRREDNYVAGLSMGGYGALKIGLKNCEHFCAAAGLSSVADIEGSSQLFREAFYPIFGENLEIPDSENLFKLAEAKNGHPLKPRIFMAVGTEDSLYEGNCKLREAFQGLDYDFTYCESAGTHSWEFWDEYIQYVLAWMFGEK